MVRKTKESSQPATTTRSRRSSSSTKDLVPHEAAPAPAVVPEGNPYLAFGESASQRPIEGKLLRFNKGDFIAGQDEEEIPEGTRFVAIMPTLQTGWTRWSGDTVDRQILCLVDSDPPEIVPRREELGDMDSKLWELDDNDKPRDPWNRTIQIILRAEDDLSDVYTFATQSKGGISAVGELAKNYGKEMRLRPNEFPIIEIGVKSYNHSNKQFGRIKVPTFTVVGWISADEATDPPAEAPSTRKSPGRKTASTRSPRRR